MNITEDDVEFDTDEVLQNPSNIIKSVADEIISSGESVPAITNKKDYEVAPSGDRHDFTSLTHYKMERTGDGGLDWEDGALNPEATMFKDLERLHEATSIVFLTTQAAIEAKKSNEDPEKYAGYSESVLKMWFIDDETKMNPNLKFSQMIKGEDDGNYFGIIDGNILLIFLEEADRLEENDLIDSETTEGVKEWFGDYLDWLVESPKGEREKQMSNNHGTYYDVQVARIADFLGKEDLVKDTLERSRQRIAFQFNEEGDMPLEKSREDSFGYSLFNLAGFSRLAQIGDKHGIDLWNYKTDDGVGLETAFKHYLNVLPSEKEAPLDPIWERHLYMAYRAAAKAYDNNEFFEAPTRYFPNNHMADYVTREMFGFKDR